MAAPPLQPSSVRIRISEPEISTASSATASASTLTADSASPIPSSSRQTTPPLRSALKNGYLSSEDAMHPAEKSSSSNNVPLSRTSTGVSLAHGYRKGVAFDTFPSGDDALTGGGTGIHFGFTLSAKSAGYERTKNTRTFLVGTDLNEYSVHALNWLLNNLLESGDEIIVLRVMDPALKDPAPTNIEQTQEEARDEAEQVLQSILDALPDLSVSIILEFCVGKIQPTIQRMIRLYKPDSLVVGTRGRTESVWRKTFMGSTSKYCLSSSPVPVIVVRPERKVRKSIEARKSRSSYSNLISSKPGLVHSASDYGSRHSTSLARQRDSSSFATPVTAEELEPTAEAGGSGLVLADAAATSSAVTAGPTSASPSNNVRKSGMLATLAEDKDLLTNILTMGMYSVMKSNSKELKRSKTAPS